MVNFPAKLYLLKELTPLVLRKRGEETALKLRLRLDHVVQLLDHLGLLPQHMLSHLAKFLLQGLVLAAQVVVLLQNPLQFVRLSVSALHQRQLQSQFLLFPIHVHQLFPKRLLFLFLLRLSLIRRFSEFLQLLYCLVSIQLKLFDFEHEFIQQSSENRFEVLVFGQDVLNDLLVERETFQKRDDFEHQLGVLFSLEV